VRRTVNASARQPFQPAISYIDGHLAEKLTEHELAVYCDMSSIKFSRGFRRAFGMTFQEYLLRLRINESQRLLRNPKASVVDVSYTVGFRDQSYFCRVFKRFVGMTPTLFRGANCGVSCREPCNLGEPLYLDNDLHRREDDSA
jgi:AraC-like DNA-binding protein